MVIIDHREQLEVYCWCRCVTLHSWLPFRPARATCRHPDMQEIDPDHTMLLSESLAGPLPFISSAPGPNADSDSEYFSRVQIRSPNRLIFRTLEKEVFIKRRGVSYHAS